MPHPVTPPRRGEIYWVEFEPHRGSEQAGTRPAVVVSLDSHNRRLPTVVVAALTTQIRHRDSPVAVYLPTGSPMKREGCILAFQVMTVDQQRLKGYAGCLSAKQRTDLDEALAVAFGLRLP